MPDGIPDGITREDLEQAIADFDAGVEHPFAESTGYDLVFGGRRYPPKAIVGLAARRLADRTLTPYDFKGGEGSRCFRILEDKGFDIAEKPNQPNAETVPTYLLTWNPDRWPWLDLYQASKQTAARKPYATLWSLGNRKTLTGGGRAFLLKQGAEPRGIIAAGWATSGEVSLLPHYITERAERGETAPRGNFEFERILNPTIDPPLAVEDIETGPLSEVYWATPASGNQLPEDAAAELERQWSQHIQRINWKNGESNLLPTEAASPINPELGYVPTGDDSREAAVREIRLRRGQQQFRNALRIRYGDRCMISGCQLLDVVEAAHIKPYRGAPDNHPENGLLLRADLHTLFDLDLIGIEPDTLRVHVHSDAINCGYRAFDGETLLSDRSQVSHSALAIRWNAFTKKVALSQEQQSANSEP